METSNIIGLIGLIVAIVTLIITIVEKWSEIGPKVRNLICWTRSVFRYPVENVSRRKFVGALGFLGVAGVVGLIFKRNIFPHGGDVDVADPIGVSRDLLSSDSDVINKTSMENDFNDVDSLIVNSKSGVAHHLKACRDHLPTSYTLARPGDTKNIHGGKKAQIAVLMSSNVSGELAEEMLIDAVKSSPTTIHLYKYLIKHWGRNKEYEKIHTFLNANIKYLTSKMNAAKNKKEFKKYKKAVTDLTTRLHRAEYLASMSSVS